MRKTINYIILIGLIGLTGCEGYEENFRKAIDDNDINKAQSMINNHPELLYNSLVRTEFRPIDFAAYTNNIPMGQMLINMGAKNQQIPKDYFKKPLNIALFKGHLKFIEFLIKNGLKENVFTDCALDKVDKIESYIAQNNSCLDVRAGTINLLGVTVIFNKLHLAKLLLDNGADVNKYVFWSPAVLAASKNNVEFLKLFIENGYDISKGGKDLLHKARITKSKDVIAFLTKLKVSPVKTSKNPSAMEILESIK